MRRSARGQSGQSLVELALILTVFSLLLLGAVDVARLYGTSVQVTNAAHEGAKLAAEDYSSYSGNPSGLAALVKSQVVQEGLLDPNSISDLSVTTQTPTTPDYPGEQIVQVSLRYKFTFVGPWSYVLGFSNPWTMPTVSSAEVTR
ncbi:MAG TPA: TadE family protein [Chloroflexota bacterium]|nr:TadE family protein [Chloroflexota bacterium]